MSDSAVRVLHVDDDPSILDLSESWFGQIDVAVDTVTDPHEALDTFDPEAFDCVVSDYQMPGLDGIELYERLQSQFPHPEFPFILFTGRGSEEVAADALNAGVTGYLQKGGTEQYERLTNRVQNATAQYASARKSERYETVLDALNYPVYVLDEEGRYRFVNDALVDLVGYDREEIIGEPSAFLKPPTTVQRAEDELGQLLSDSGPAVSRFEVALERADGTRILCRDHMGVLPYEGESFRGSTGILRPIAITGAQTDEREDLGLPPTLSRSLADADDRPIFEQFPDPILLVEYVDGDPIVSGVNEAFEQVFRYGRETAIGASVNDLIVPATDTEAATALDQQARAGETIRRVVERQTATGDNRRMLLRAVPVSGDDDQSRIAAVYTDVTGSAPDRREFDQYRTLIESLADPVYMLDRHGRFEYVNDAFIDLVGYSRAEILGSDPSIVKSKAACETAAEYLGRLLSDDGPEDVHFEIEIEPKDGSPIPCEDHMCVLPYQGAEFRGSVGVLRDIRSQKERERELQRQNERLDEFASLVSHDLRNPLTVAQGQLELARRDHDSETLEKVADAHDRMLELIEGLLTLAREAEQVGELESVDLAGLVETCWQNVATGAATLTVDTTASILADRARLQQLVENLIRNSVEHGSTSSRPEADDAVEHGGDDVRIEVGDLADDGFYVADDGRGIPADERDDVFEAGYSTAQSGTGFGLAIVQRVAEGHDWDITVTESDQGGARFEISGVKTGCDDEMRAD